MNIKIYIISIILIIICYNNLNAGLLINEIASATTGDDWVELFYYSPDKESMNISGLYVTMYYGANENLSADPVTIYSYDRPETPWDDRFVVIHFAASGMTDETDNTGDTNRNGCMDLYRNISAGNLWTTDCVVAIDADDDPNNGNTIDFAAYSNRDGSVNETIEQYLIAAQNINQWNTCPGKTSQECMIDIGVNTLAPYMTISRKSPADTNSLNDFSVTKYMTPGRENILSENISSGRNLFKTIKNKISIGPENFANGNVNIELFVFEECNIRLRIFSSIGVLIYESPLYTNTGPGNFPITWDIKGSGKKAATGLYFAQIEATRKELKKSQEERVYVIVSQYKK
ncbi:MAG: hypothetical protein V1874_00770 [Spirochaetota bacterium]